MMPGKNQINTLIWETNREVIWTEVYVGQDSVLGVTTLGEWVLFFNNGNKLFLLEKGQLELALLPYLKKDLKEFYTSLKQALIERNLSPDLVAEFPFKETLLTAFRIESGYWITLALAWIEQLPKPLAEEFLPYIQESADRGPIKEKARKFLKNYCKKNNLIIS
jgi:hypothetical protein